MIGVIANYSTKKHFGFIRYPEGKIFFHQLELEHFTELPKGTQVTFEKGDYYGRPVAKKVREYHPAGEIIPATPAEIDLLKSYGVDLSNGAKVRAALSAIRSIKKDGDQ